MAETPAIRTNESLGGRYVDMWAFAGMHPTNVELLRKLRSADDRQFATNMEVCGSISEQDKKTGEWDSTHLVGIRSDIWKPDKEELERSVNAIHRRRYDFLRRKIKKSGRLTASQTEQLEKRVQEDAQLSIGSDDIEKRRLVLKIFKTTSQRIRWCGTIEEVTTREIHNSIGSKRALISFVVGLPGYDYLTILQENHRTFRVPSIFTFSFYDETNQRMWYINLKRKWVSIGADFVIESEDRPIGLIDGRLLGFGYNAGLTVTEPTLAQNSKFMDLLTLFGSTVGYHRAMRRSIKRCIKAARAGEINKHVIEDEEFKLLKNPRRNVA